MNKTDAQIIINRTRTFSSDVGISKLTTGRRCTIGYIATMNGDSGPKPNEKDTDISCGTVIDTLKPMRAYVASGYPNFQEKKI